MGAELQSVTDGRTNRWMQCEYSATQAKLSWSLSICVLACMHIFRFDIVRSLSPICKDSKTVTNFFVACSGVELQSVTHNPMHGRTQCEYSATQAKLSWSLSLSWAICFIFRYHAKNQLLNLKNKKVMVIFIAQLRLQFQLSFAWVALYSQCICLGEVANFLNMGRIIWLWGG